MLSAVADVVTPAVTTALADPPPGGPVVMKVWAGVLAVLLIVVILLLCYRTVPCRHRRATKGFYEGSEECPDCGAYRWDGGPWYFG